MGRFAAAFILGFGMAALWYLGSNARCTTDSNSQPSPFPHSTICFIVWNDPTTAWAWWKPGRDVPSKFDEVIR